MGKSIEIEVIARRTVGGNRIANLVRPYNRSVSSWIRIGLVVGYAVGRSQVWPCFEQRDRVDIPATEDSAYDRGRVQPLPSLAEWQLIGSRHQEPLSTRSNNISTVGTDVEAIQVCKSIASLALECGESIALSIADVMGPGVVGLIG